VGSIAKCVNRDGKITIIYDDQDFQRKLIQKKWFKVVGIGGFKRMGKLITCHILELGCIA
jgi:hypothetical protein